eukprot:TRINITY_DN71351_c0_g1_i1.p2 TRINITY_DN71351_c0_g1~~TRINITY_DN71351_c0_g1_i1.p2  ORF type:complete len:285 (+),score=119.91 TRINITY_DN71351_c0_g1_i1:90-944(+)
MAEGDHPAILDRFAEFATSESFSHDVDAWMDSRCGSFEKWTVGGEQQLEWTACYKEYQEFVEKQLSSFCDREGTTADAVFKEIQEWMQKSTDAGTFVPAFIQNTEYETFAANMHEHAVCAQTTARARAASSSKVEGLWQCCAEKQDPDGIEAYLALLGCPYVFRKVLKKAAMLTKNVSITVQEDHVELVYKIMFFGTTRQVWKTDGKPQPGKNLWRQDVTVECQLMDCGGIETNMYGFKGRPEGTKTRTCLVREGDYLVLDAVATCPGQGTVTNKTYFVADTSA